MQKSGGEVVITGLGVVSSLGVGGAHVFGRLCQNETAARPAQRFAGLNLTQTTAALVDPTDVFRTLDHEEQKLPWGAAMGLQAARQALAAAHCPEQIGSMPVFVSNALGCAADYEPESAGWEMIDTACPQALARYLHGNVVAAFATAIGAQGPVRCISATCAGGNYAVGAALDYLRDGYTGPVLAGGADGMLHTSYAGFHQLRAIGTTCRPLVPEGDGILPGEGAAFLVLETAASAEARGVRPLGALGGVGYSNDAHHMVAPEPTGLGAARAMVRAMADAGLGVDDIGYVNAHGTGTPLNAVAETRAIAETFAQRSEPVLVSSIKGAVGHTMGAAGTIEAVATVMAIEAGLIPPNAGATSVDAPPLVDVVLESARQKPLRAALSNGFGFGGNNATLVLTRPGVAKPAFANRDVYISHGAAMVCGAHGVVPFWDRLKSGRKFEGAEAIWDFEPKAYLGTKGLRHVPRCALVLAALCEQELSACFDGDMDRLGASVGVAIPVIESALAIERSFRQDGALRVNPMHVQFGTSNTAVSWLAMRKGITGYTSTHSSHTAAGLDAVVDAAMQIRRGRIDCALAGGVNPIVAEKYALLEAMYPASVGYAEGCGVVALTASKQNAWARLAGSGSAFDSSNPDAATAQAMAQALGAANLARVDLCLTESPIAGTFLADDVLILAPIIGTTLAASGPIGLLGASLFLTGEADRYQSVMVVSQSSLGYASAVVLTLP